LSNPSIKRKSSDKTDHLPKKSKVVVGSAGVTPNEGKLTPLHIHGKGKGLMTG